MKREQGNEEKERKEGKEVTREMRERVSAYIKNEEEIHI